MGSVKGLSVSNKTNSIEKVNSFDKSSNIKSSIGEGTSMEELKPLNIEPDVAVEYFGILPSEEKIEQAAEEEAEVIDGIEEGEVSSDEFAKRIKEQDEDLINYNDQLKNVNSLIDEYSYKKNHIPSDYKNMKNRYNRAMGNSINYSQKEGYVVTVNEEERRKVRLEYAKYAKKYGYDSMDEMINVIDTCDKALDELESARRVLERKIQSKYNVIDYVCKYGLRAEKESYESAGKIKTMNISGDLYLMYENNNCDPLQKYTDAVAAGLGDACKVDDRIIHLYEASQNDPSLGQIYQFLYKNVGKDAAEEYLDDIEEYMNQNAGVYEAAKYLDNFKNQSSIDKPVMEFEQGFSDGFNSFFQGLNQVFKNDDSLTVLDYKKMYILYSLTNEEEYSEMAYELGLGAGSVTVPLAVALVFPGSIGAIGAAAVSGTSVYGNTVHNCLVNGIDYEDARSYGALAGSFDSAVWMLGGKLNTLCKAKFGCSARQFLVANTGTASGLGASTFIIQVNSKADQLLRSGDYYLKHPNDKFAAYRAAYDDAYEAMGGDLGFFKKIGFAGGAGLIVGGMQVGGMKNASAVESIEKGRTSQFLDDSVEASVLDDGGNSESTYESEAIDTTAGVVGEGSLVFSKSQISFASNVLSYIKSMNSSMDTNNERD